MWLRSTFLVCVTAFAVVKSTPIVIKGSNGFGQIAITNNSKWIECPIVALHNFHVWDTVYQIGQNQKLSLLLPNYERLLGYVNSCIEKIKKENSDSLRNSLVLMNYVKTATLSKIFRIKNDIVNYPVNGLYRNITLTQFIYEKINIMETYNEPLRKISNVWNHRYQYEYIILDRAIAAEIFIKNYLPEIGEVIKKFERERDEVETTKLRVLQIASRGLLLAAQMGEILIKMTKDYSHMINSQGLLSAVLKSKENFFNDTEYKWIEDFKENQSDLEKIYNITASIILSTDDFVKTIAGRLDFYGKEHLGIDVNKWRIPEAIKDIQIQVQKMTSEFEGDRFLKSCFEKTKYAISKLIDLYDFIQSRYKRMEIHDGIDDIMRETQSDNNYDDDYYASPRSNTKNVSLDVLEQAIMSDLLWFEYEPAIRAAQIYIFPYADENEQWFTELPYSSNNTRGALFEAQKILYSEIRKNFEDNIVGVGFNRTLPGKPAGPVEKAQKIYDKKLQDSLVVGGASAGKVSGEQLGPFFVWIHDLYGEEISKLLQGKEIIIKADIEQGLRENAVKFDKIGLHFKLFNETLQKEFDRELTFFRVWMTHLGDSHYKCGDKLYLMSHNYVFFDVNYTDPVNDPRSYSQLLSYDVPMASPYAMWKIKILVDGYDDVGNKENILAKYANEPMDLELIGTGEYVDTWSASCDQNLEKYYKKVGTIPYTDEELAWKKQKVEIDRFLAPFYDQLNNS